MRIQFGQEDVTTKVAVAIRACRLRQSRESEITRRLHRRPFQNSLNRHGRRIASVPLFLCWFDRIPFTILQSIALLAFQKRLVVS